MAPEQIAADPNVDHRAGHLRGRRPDVRTARGTTAVRVRRTAVPCSPHIAQRSPSPFSRYVRTHLRRWPTPSCDVSRNARATGGRASVTCSRGSTVTCRVRCQERAARGMETIRRRQRGRRRLAHGVGSSAAWPRLPSSSQSVSSRMECESPTTHFPSTRAKLSWSRSACRASTHCCNICRRASSISWPQSSRARRARRRGLARRDQRVESRNVVV